jgi:hypothetical protein
VLNREDAHEPTDLSGDLLSLQKELQPKVDDPASEKLWLARPGAAGGDSANKDAQP